MKIVQSYWTKPSIKNNQFNDFDRSFGGWNEAKYNCFSWALSCLKFKEFYSNVELYTDKLGYDLLINKLELPYSKVHVVLDDLNHFHHDLWAIGKIYTYSMQNEPFLHADGDIFIYRRFENNLLDKELIAQNSENNFGNYFESYEEVINNFTFLPNYLNVFSRKEAKFSGINAGVLGGNNLVFFKEYADRVFEFINLNLELLNKINIGLFNNFYEQLLFKLMADESKIQISYVLKSVNDRFDKLVDFTGLPSNQWFIHPVGFYKKRAEVSEHLEYRLKLEFPNYYYRIIKLLKFHKI